MFGTGDSPWPNAAFESKLALPPDGHAFWDQPVFLLAEGILDGVGGIWTVLDGIWLGWTGLDLFGWGLTGRAWMGSDGLGWD